MVKVHGGNILEMAEKYKIEPKDIIDFSANINPLGLSGEIKKVIIENIDNIIHYPDINYKSLKNSIAIHHSCKSDQIFLGNGASEIIYVLPASLKSKKVLILSPTFSEYEEAIKLVDGEVVYFSMERENFIIDETKIIDLLNIEKVDTIWICNPNNPTGDVIKFSQLEVILNYCQLKNINFIIDEAFMDFVDDQQNSLINKVDGNPNLFIIRSLTKIFAIPGLRLGYLLTSNYDILKKMEEASVPWRINTFVDKIGQAMLKNNLFIKESISYVNKERNYLVENLEKVQDIILYPSVTNFLFFCWKNDLDLKDKMMKNGILIRSCENFKNLSKTYYRIAVRTHEENIYFINTLNKIMSENL